MNQKTEPTPDRSPERIQEIRAEIATVLRQVEMTEHRATLLPGTSFGVSNAVTAADWHERVTWLVSVLKKADAQVEADAAQIASLRQQIDKFQDAAFHFQTCRTCRQSGDHACVDGRQFAAFLRGEV